MATPEMQAMNILEYEQRVKKYAAPANKGFINKVQLLVAFKGTGVFEHMNDEHSLRTKFILSPFVADFHIGSKLNESKQLEISIQKKLR